MTDSAAGIVACFLQAMGLVGPARPADEVFARLVGPPVLQSLRCASLDEEQVEWASAAYWARHDTDGWADNAVYPGIPEPELRP